MRDKTMILRDGEPGKDRCHTFLPMDWKTQNLLDELLGKLRAGLLGSLKVTPIIGGENRNGQIFGTEFDLEGLDILLHQCGDLVKVARVERGGHWEEAAGELDVPL